jgi:hypothetical protein
MDWVMRREPCVVSVAEHTGWAHVVCVGVRDQTPAVIERRRMELIDRGLPTLPYHHDTIAMSEDDANALIARVRQSIAARTSDSLTGVVTELAPDYAVVALAIREPPFAELPETVAEVRKSYLLQCAADGMMYQLAFCGAARQLGLDVQMCRRGKETSRAADQLRVTPEIIQQFVARTGRPAGPPWTQEHRRAYAAGIAALAAYPCARIRIPSS